MGDVAASANAAFVKHGQNRTDGKHLVSVLIVGLSYGARNVISYTRRLMQNFLACRDSPIIPLRRLPNIAATAKKEGQNKILRPALPSFLSSFLPLFSLSRLMSAERLPSRLSLSRARWAERTNNNGNWFIKILLSWQTLLFPSPLSVSRSRSVSRLQRVPYSWPIGAIAYRVFRKGAKQKLPNPAQSCGKSL